MIGVPQNGRWRTLIIAEVVALCVLLVLLAAIMAYVIVDDSVFGISWFSVGIAASAVVAELVRRFRHLRSDLRRDYLK